MVYIVRAECWRLEGDGVATSYAEHWAANLAANTTGRGKPYMASLLNALWADGQADLLIYIDMSGSYMTFANISEGYAGTEESRVRPKAQPPPETEPL